MKISIVMLLIIATQARGNTAVCIVPIADLVGSPLGTATHSAQKSYQALPIDGPAAAVKRIGQLLYNEVVTIIPTREPHGIDEVKIQADAYFYCTRHDKKPLTTYWTLKKNLAPQATLRDTRSIPTPIDYHSAQTQTNVITLLAPWYDTVYKRHYSVGTRFVLTDKQHSSHFFNVYVLSPNLKTVSINIPQELCLNTATLNNDERIAQFLEILRWIAKHDHNNVAYVFGGASMNTRYKKNAPAYIIDKPYNVTKPHSGPYSGLDCATLILRSAQMAELPFFYKNTSAIAHYLKPVQATDAIHDGDIIYTAGHVMVITDVAKNMIIEARTAQDGYGFVHECPLSEVFQEISTCAELLTAHHTKKSVTRIARNGKPIIHSAPFLTARTNIQILKLRSIFDGDSLLRD